MSTIEQAKTAVLLNRSSFHRDFYEWLVANFHIYEYFENECFKFVKAGQQRIGSRMIIEHIRYRTKLRELEGDGWKINNSVSPDLPRLFALLNSEHAELFEFRHVMNEGTIKI